jgi:hypothetical protein
MVELGSILKIGPEGFIDIGCGLWRERGSKQGPAFWPEPLRKELSGAGVG